MEHRLSPLERTAKKKVVLCPGNTVRGQGSAAGLFKLESLLRQENKDCRIAPPGSLVRCLMKNLRRRGENTSGLCGRFFIFLSSF